MTRKTSGTGGHLYGTLEVLILQVLHAKGAMHGLDIARRIEDRSHDFFRIEEGALYPALHRLKNKGMIEGEWRVSTKGRRARFYELTDEGRERLRDEIAGWLRHTEAVRRVLELGEDVNGQR